MGNKIAALKHSLHTVNLKYIGKYGKYESIVLYCDPTIEHINPDFLQHLQNIQLNTIDPYQNYIITIRNEPNFSQNLPLLRK